MLQPKRECALKTNIIFDKQYTKVCAFTQAYSRYAMGCVAPASWLHKK